MPGFVRKDRKSLRLKDYDYAGQAAYFITLVAHQCECLFGEIAQGILRPNVYGKIVAEEWLRSAEIRDEILLDEFVVMPNHFHAVVWIVGVDGAPVGATMPAPVVGDRPVAPTTHAKRPPTAFVGCVGGGVQIVRNQTDQRGEGNPRRAGLATQL